MTLSLTLYSTFACHLCEDAEALLKPWVESGRVELLIRDIVDNPDWLNQYRLTIPVLADADTELAWPFDAQQLAQWLAPRLRQQ